MDFSKDTTALLVQDFELEPGKEVLSEEELLELLANRVYYMIEHKMDFLLSLMYRLDIREDKINFALSPRASDPPAIGLAKLIIERQKDRIKTKHQYRSSPPAEPGEDWEW